MSFVQLTSLRIWLPVLYILCGFMFSKLLELSFSDRKEYEPIIAGFHSGSIDSSHAPVRNVSIPGGLYSSLTASTDPVSGQPSRENAVFVVLSRNSDVYDLAKSIRSVEDRFNHKYGYDWVFLNDVPFDEEFKNVTSSLVSGIARYGLVPEEHWSYPSWIDRNRAAEVRAWAANQYLYGGSESYRHMCRFFSGFFYRHELLQQYDYYWRVEPETELWCDIDFDPFHYMRTEKKKYGFVITMPDYYQTIPSLWTTVKSFFRAHPEYLAESNSKDFLSNNGGRTYNGCHFWSNFEIGSFDWLRSSRYQAFFEHLDKAGGFFYERWGDAPVHSIAASLLLNRTEIHHFNDIAYSHPPIVHCPTGQSIQRKNKCYCDPTKNFDWDVYSCLPRWYELNDIPKPDGYEEEMAFAEQERRKKQEAEEAARAEEEAARAEEQARNLKVERVAAMLRRILSDRRISPYRNIPSNRKVSRRSRRSMGSVGIY